MKKHVSAMVCLLAMVLAAVPMFGQNPATFGNSQGKYGLTSWAINNQRVASQFNYDIDATFQTGVGGTFTFPCSEFSPLTFGANINKTPWALNASVKVVDQVSANTETVALNSLPTCGAGGSGNFTLNLATANAHSSFHLRSGTCGLQEAINDLGANAGEVIIDQKFYDDGCTQSTITGLNPLVTSTSGPIRQNVYIHDISAGQDTWYAIKPTTTTLISAAAAPTTGTVTGGTFTNGNVIITTVYVDELGNQSLPSSETTQATGGTTNGLSVTAPAASTGAVGYLVYCTAVGGSTGTEIGCGTGTGGYPNATNCTLTTLETVIPACAIGANFTVLAPVTSTAKQPILGTAHTTFGFQSFNTFPGFAPTNTNGTFQTLYLPFAATATVASGNSADVAVMHIPAGYFNRLGGSWDVCFKIASTNVATAVPTWTLTAATLYGQTIRTLDTVLLPTQTGAVTTNGCFNMTTAATGTSGTFWVGTLGPVTEAINSTGVTVSGMDVTTAVSSTLDLTKDMYLAINLAAGTANITGVTPNIVSIRPVNGN